MLKRWSIGRDLPPRLRWYVLTTILMGVPVVAAGGAFAVQHQPTTHLLVGVGAFFLLAMLAEWRPVPIDVEGNRLVSLAFVFIVSSRLLFGWEWSILIGAFAIGLAMLIDRTAPIKALFNSATYALAAGLAATPAIFLGVPRGNYELLVRVVTSGSIFVLANVLLVCVAIGLATQTSIRNAFVDHLRYSGPIFAISVFVAAQAVILWRLSPPLVILLSAPLFALTMYQRSAIRGRIAEQEAATDSLTSLKNRRAFEDEAENTLASARDDSAEFVLGLIDIDRFKQINDRYGHAVGDVVLQMLAAAIEQTVPGKGFRLGGDEFVLLLPARNYTEIVEAVQTRFARRQRDLATLTETVTVSAGLAIYPHHADDLHTLQKRADLALYRSKYGGRACVTVYDADEAATPFLAAVTRATPIGSSGAGYDRAVRNDRLTTAQRIVSLVDALSDAAVDSSGVLPSSELAEVLDQWTGLKAKHSPAVASLTCSLAQIVGVTGEELEQVFIGALLHDVGKIAIPDRILNKPGPLEPDERRLVERHPIIGYELLADLGSPEAAKFVLHHHERWDGGGYPLGLAGAEIPFGSRLILVADAFDALTSDRVYRRAVSVEAAIHEVQCESGRQFDPLIVSALHEHFAHPAAPESKAAQSELEAAWSSSTSSS